MTVLPAATARASCSTTPAERHGQKTGSWRQAEGAGTRGREGAGGGQLGAGSTVRVARACGPTRLITDWVAAGL